MANKCEYYEIKFLILVLFGLPLITATNIDCNGKAFHCVNATHFMICVDLGSGVSKTLDDYVIPCPPTTGCRASNTYECEYLRVTSTVPTITTSEANNQVTDANNLAWEPISVTTSGQKTNESEQSEKYYNTLNVSTLPSELDATAAAEPIELMTPSSSQDTVVDVDLDVPNYDITTETHVILSTDTFNNTRELREERNTETSTAASTSITNYETAYSNAETSLKESFSSTNLIVDDTTVEPKLILSESYNIQTTVIPSTIDMTPPSSDSVSTENTFSSIVSEINETSTNSVLEANLIEDGSIVTETVAVDFDYTSIFTELPSTMPSAEHTTITTVYLPEAKLPISESVVNKTSSGTELEITSTENANNIDGIFVSEINNTTTVTDDVPTETSTIININYKKNLLQEADVLSPIAEDISTVNKTDRPSEMVAIPGLDENIPVELITSGMNDPTDFTIFSTNVPSETTTTKIILEAGQTSLFVAEESPTTMSTAMNVQTYAEETIEPRSSLVAGEITTLTKILTATENSETLKIPTADLATITTFFPATVRTDNVKTNVEEIGTATILPGVWNSKNIETSEGEVTTIKTTVPSGTESFKGINMIAGEASTTTIISLANQNLKNNETITEVANFENSENMQIVTEKVTIPTTILPGIENPKNNKTSEEDKAVTTTNVTANQNFENIKTVTEVTDFMNSENTNTSPEKLTTTTVLSGTENFEDIKTIADKVKTVTTSLPANQGLENIKAVTEATKFENSENLQVAAVEVITVTTILSDIENRENIATSAGEVTTIRTVLSGTKNTETLKLMAGEAKTTTLPANENLENIKTITEVPAKYPGNENSDNLNKSHTSTTGESPSEVNKEKKWDTMFTNTASELNDTITAPGKEADKKTKDINIDGKITQPYSITTKSEAEVSPLYFTLLPDPDTNNITTTVIPEPKPSHDNMNLNISKIVTAKPNETAIEPTKYVTNFTFTELLNITEPDPGVMSSLPESYPFPNKISTVTSFTSIRTISSPESDVPATTTEETRNSERNKLFSKIITMDNIITLFNEQEASTQSFVAEDSISYTKSSTLLSTKETRTAIKESTTERITSASSLVAEETISDKSATLLTQATETNNLLLETQGLSPSSAAEEKINDTRTSLVSNSMSTETITNDFTGELEIFEVVDKKNNDLSFTQLSITPGNVATVSIPASVSAAVTDTNIKTNSIAATEINMFENHTTLNIKSDGFNFNINTESTTVDPSLTKDLSTSSNTDTVVETVVITASPIAYQESKTSLYSSNKKVTTKATTQISWVDTEVTSSNIIDTATSRILDTEKSTTNNYKEVGSKNTESLIDNSIIAPLDKTSVTEIVTKLTKKVDDYSTTSNTVNLLDKGSVDTISGQTQSVVNQPTPKTIDYSRQVSEQELKANEILNIQAVTSKIGTLDRDDFFSALNEDTSVPSTPASLANGFDNQLIDSLKVVSDSSLFIVNSINSTTNSLSDVISTLGIDTIKGKNMTTKISNAIKVISLNNTTQTNINDHEKDTTKLKTTVNVEVKIIGTSEQNSTVTSATAIEVILKAPATTTATNLGSAYSGLTEKRNDIYSDNPLKDLILNSKGQPDGSSTTTDDYTVRSNVEPFIQGSYNISPAYPNTAGGTTYINKDYTRVTNDSGKHLQQTTIATVPPLILDSKGYSASKVTRQDQKNSVHTGSTPKLVISENNFKEVVNMNSINDATVTPAMPNSNADRNQGVKYNPNYSTQTVFKENRSLADKDTVANTEKNSFNEATTETVTKGINEQQVVDMTVTNADLYSATNENSAFHVTNTPEHVDSGFITITKVIFNDDTQNIQDTNSNPAHYPTEVVPSTLGKSYSNPSEQMTNTDIFTSEPASPKTVNYPKALSDKTTEASTTQRTTETTKATVLTTTTSSSLPFNCFGRYRGRYGAQDDCRKYYVCIGRVLPIIGICPENTVFSEVHKQCTRNLSHCIRGSEFQCASNGRFSDIYRNNIYYICVRDNVGKFYRFKFQCQMGFYLNKTAMKCQEYKVTPNISESVQSEDSTSKSENDKSISKKKSKEENEKKKFECEEEGKFPHPGNCRKYYECKKKKSQFRRKTRKCDSDELFHKEKKKCVSAESYEC